MRFLPAALLALALVPSAQAGLTGNSLAVDYRYPTLGTDYAQASFTNDTFVIGAGVESVADIEGVTFLSIDFADQSLTIDFNTTLTTPTWVNSSFNGLLFDALSPAALGITGFTVDAATTLPGFDASRVTLTSTQLGLNWAGISYLDGQKLVLNFTTAPVPEPAALISTTLGLATLATVTHRRRRPTPA